MGWGRGVCRQPRTVYVTPTLRYAKGANPNFFALSRPAEVSQTRTVAGSTLTPGPIVVEIATR